MENSHRITDRDRNESEKQESVRLDSIWFLLFIEKLLLITEEQLFIIRPIDIQSMWIQIPKKKEMSTYTYVSPKVDRFIWVIF